MKAIQTFRLRMVEFVLECPRSRGLAWMWSSVLLRSEKVGEPILHSKISWRDWLPEKWISMWWRILLNPVRWIRFRATVIKKSLPMRILWMLSAKTGVTIWQDRYRYLILVTRALRKQSSIHCRMLLWWKKIVPVFRPILQPKKNRKTTVLQMVNVLSSEVCSWIKSWKQQKIIRWWRSLRSRICMGQWKL